MAMSMSSTFTGRVVSVNERGLKLDGHESWFNISKWAKDVVLPERGQTATCTVDASGFLRACTIATAPGTTMSQNGVESATSGHKDRTITRLAVLKAAAEFGASRPELKSGDVLKIAASWERWVLRDADDLGLVEAF